MKRRSCNKLVGSTPKTMKTSNNKVQNNEFRSLRSGQSGPVCRKSDELTGPDPKRRKSQDLPGSGETSAQGHNQIQWFKTKRFDQIFDFQKMKTSTTFEVVCTLCPKRKLLSASTISSFNLKSHLEVNSTLLKFHLVSTLLNLYIVIAENAQIDIR